MDTGQQHYLFQHLARPERLHRPLLSVAWAMAATGLVSVIGLLADERTLGGQPIWGKPLKFSVSIAIYALTMAYLLPMLRRRKRAGWWMGTIMAVMLYLEMVVIVAQVLRGRASHFNIATTFDTIGWTIMGVSITVLWVANLVAGIFLARASLGDRSVTRAIRWGIGVGLVGLALAFFMPRQDTSAIEGVAGAHAVGVADGGPGLWLLGWSTTGGDLRIAHFVGIHAMQLLPLLAFALVWLARRRPAWHDDARRSRVVVVAALSYLSLTMLVFWQAMRGEPLVRPSGLTLAVAAVLLVASAVGLLVAARPSSPAPAERVADPALVG